MQIDPQSMHFDNGFIKSFSRPLSFGLILSYNIDHILFSRKIGILAEKSKQRQFCSANITKKKKVQKTWSIPWRSWRKILQNRHKGINLWHIAGGVICRTKSAIFDRFENSWKKQFFYQTKYDQIYSSILGQN